MTREEELNLVFAPSEKRVRNTPVRKKRGSFKDINALEGIKRNAYAMDLFDGKDVLMKLEIIKQQRDSQELQTCLRKMQSISGQFFLVPQPSGYEASLNGLLNKYPHFENVVEFLRQRMRLNGVREYPILDFGAAILLDGPSGCGKTSFLTELSQNFNTEFVSISCAAATNSFDITGLSAGWGNGRAGKLHDLLINMGCPNPVCLLDEIDKTNNGSERQNFTGALYGLLEKNNAKIFQDEYVGVTMDASRINWFATSNDVSRLDAPLRDRFEVISVEAPDERQMLQIIPQIFRSTVIEMGIQNAFATVLKKDVLDKLLSCNGTSMRRVQSVLKTGLANATVRVKKGGAKVLLKPSDIPNQDSFKAKQKIGFIH